MAKYKITRDKFLTPDECRKLLKVCRDLADLDLTKGRQTWITRYMLVDLAIRSGLRVGEIASLKVGDLHLNGKDHYLAVKDGKGSKDRDVYIDPVLTKHLRDYLVIKRKAWRQDTNPGAYLFPSREGKPYTTTALHISFKKALERAGLPLHHSIHHARHTYATVSLATSDNLRFVQKQLGHENIGHTALYADLLPEKNRELSRKFEI